MRTAFVALLVVLLAALVAQAEGWSILHPFSGSSTTSDAPKRPKPVPRTTIAAKQEPSALQKLGTGTKNFFTGIGAALTPKKTPSKKPDPYKTSYFNPNQAAAKKSSSSSWNPFHREEKPKKQTVNDFMSLKRPE
jgi:hypothetical protein